MVKIDADFGANASGVLYALGGGSGGLSLYMDGGQLTYEYNMMIVERYFVRTQIVFLQGDTTGAAALPVVLAVPGHAQEKQDLAEQAVDPTASLMSFHVIDNFSADVWQEDGTSNDVLFRAAIPFRAWRASNILRITVPYTTGGVRGAGLGSTQIFDLIVFQESWGRWGLGPLVRLGQDGGPDGAGPFAIGPALGM